MADNNPNILFLSDKFTPEAVESARKVGNVTIVADPDEQDILNHITNADALVIRTGARITEKVLEHAKNLKVIGRGGVGLDNVDLEACKKRNIAVVHTPRAATKAVAELTVSLITQCARMLPMATSMAKLGRHSKARKTLIGFDLSELTIGIVGFGHIGQEVGKICQLGLGMRVIHNDIVETKPVTYETEYAEQNTLFNIADVVTLHVPLTPETTNMINKNTISKMKPGAILINTARGPVVNTADLQNALEQGTIAAAALDITAPEPLPEDHPLWGMENVIITPHIGAATHSSQKRMSAVVDDVLAVLSGEKPKYPAW